MTATTTMTADGDPGLFADLTNPYSTGARVLDVASPPSLAPRRWICASATRASSCSAGATCRGWRGPSR